MWFVCQTDGLKLIFINFTKLFILTLSDSYAIFAAHLYPISVASDIVWKLIFPMQFINDKNIFISWSTLFYCSVEHQIC